MAKAAKTVYVCSQCGFESAKWYGRCPECGEWNSFSEEIRQAPAKASSLQSARFGAAAPAGYNPAEIMPLKEIDSNSEVRYHTGLSELDRVLGGGIVRGSVVLLGGDPGIGKSTLLLQVCEFLGEGQKILYVSGEESRAQVKLRANRLGVSSENLMLAAWARGIGTCYCGAAPMQRVVDALKERLLLPDNIRPFAIVPMGYPAETPKQPEERYHPEKIHWGKW